MLRIVYAYFPQQSKCSRIACVIWNDKPHQRLLVRCRIVSSKPRFRLPAISCAGTVHERGGRLRETTSLCQHACRHSEDSSATSILLLGCGFLGNRLLGHWLLGHWLLGDWLLGDNLLRRGLGSNFRSGLDTCFLDDFDGLLAGRLHLLHCLLRCSSDDLLCVYCRLLCCSSHCHLLC